MPRNDPGSESMTQGQEVKQPVYMPTATNAVGNESGVSDTAGLGTVSGEQAVAGGYSIKDVNTNNSTTDYSATDPSNYSTENRSAKFKNGEGGPAFDPGQYGNNQYQ